MLETSGNCRDTAAKLPAFTHPSYKPPTVSGALFVHIIAAITAYQLNPFKPKLNLQPRYQLETTA